MGEEEIVITGFSARFPQADSLAEFKEKLYAGFDFVTDDEARWPRGLLGLPGRFGTIRDLALFDANFFGIHHRQAHLMDPQMRLLLETSYEAMFDAGYEPAVLQGRKIGVFIGCSECESGQAFCSNPEKMDGYTLMGNSRALFANRLSYAYNFRGPSITVDTACSSTMTALNQAMQAIRSGQCEAAIVGASMITLNPTTGLGFHRMAMLSPNGTCFSFDSRCNGFIRSEAVGTFFLQSISEARRIYAKVVHTKSISDGFKIEGITFPSRKKQEELLRDAYSEAKVDPRKLQYIEAHGTGTKTGDPQELGAIANVCCPPGRCGPLLVGSVRSNVGHNEVASGLTSIAKVILTMETGTIAANLHFKEANPNIPSLHDGRIQVVANPTPFSGGIVGLNSFGVGGSIAHVILESNPSPHVESMPRASPEVPRLILVSGRSEISLMNTLDRLEAEGPYPDSAYALLNRVGQPSVKQFPFRGFAVVPVFDCESEVVQVVEQAPLEQLPLWFAFTGMGCQWANMGRQMMHFEVFARSMRQSAEVLRQFGMDLIEMVTNDDGVDQSIASVLASIAAVQVALVDMLRALSIQPDGIVGHSVGEIVCAYADGCLTAEQAVLCAYWRGRCTDITEVPHGAMAAVGLTWEEGEKRCRDGVMLACHNAEDSVTVSGPARAVAEMVKELKAEGAFVRMVDTMDVAFHSRHVENVVPVLREALEKVIPEPKTRSDRWICSSVLPSRWHEPVAKLCSPEYQLNNMVSPVFFREALEHVPKNAIVLEIAPHCLLLPILRRALGTGATCLGLMKRHEDNLTFFLSALGQLHTLGIQMDVSSLYPPVPWPVPRGTPSISHLVSWDHSERWRVAKWNEFAGFAEATAYFKTVQSTEDIVEVDLGANDADAYLAGHQLNGRILFPATGYMVLAWKHLAKRCGKPFHQVPVIFEDVTIHRATIMRKRGPVRFLVNLIQATGSFIIAEAGSAVASGRIRMATDEDKLVEKDQRGPPPETVVYELEAEDFYKELRLRGYEYQGEFQAILKTDLESRYGRIKWHNNWVTFLDNIVQMCILPYTDRVFRLPVKIRSCRVDTDLHDRVALETSGAGIPVVYDSCLSSFRAGGVEIVGLEIRVAPRRPPHQVVCLDEYKFVPYIDDESAKRERKACINEYMDVCNTLADRILGMCGQDMTELTGLTRDVCRVSENDLSRYVECPAEDHIILRVLNDIERNLNDPTSNLVSTVNSVLATHEEALPNDLLNRALFTEDPLRHLLDVAVENRCSKRMRILELAAERSGVLLTPLVSSLLPMSNASLKTDYIIGHPRPDSLMEDQIPEGTRKVTWDIASSTRTNLPQADLIITRNIPGERSRLEAFAEEMSTLCHERGFLLLAYRTALTPAELFLSRVGSFAMPEHARGTVESLFAGFGFCIVGLKSNNMSTVLLLKKANVDATAAKLDVVTVNNSKYNWVDILKEKVMNSEIKPAGKNVWILSDDSCTSGVVGLTKCLRVERGVHGIRCLLDASQKIQGNTADVIAESPAWKEVLEKDLIMNVFRDGQLGSYRHLSTQGNGAPKKTTEHAFLSVDTYGDLSSLRWYESPLSCASPSIGVRGVLCSVYYAPLNARDVLLATGKLPLYALPGDMATWDSLLGMEFSGRDPNGCRVMGLLSANGLATVVAADPELMWEVPDEWSIEQASTVPAAYATAYYALLVRGNMRPGQSLLVHTGSGGVGQAAIAVAISLGCTVYATVGSEEEREFLKRRFTHLEDRNIVDLHDLSVEEHVLRETKGRGVDVVLNSLSGENLQVCVRCLATKGRLLEMDKFDVAQDSPLGMSVFRKSATFSGVFLESLHDSDPQAREEKRRVRDLVTEGIASGTVRPLDTVRYRWDQAEEAFRFAASGGDTAKVVLEIRKEENTRKTAPASFLAVEAVARTWFYQHKSYVIVGGLGGFGLELANWMIGRGCRRLLLSSRTGVRTGYQKLQLWRWRIAGAEVRVTTADAATQCGASQIIEEASTMGAVGGIFNLGLVLRDALLENQTPESFEAVCRVKVDATRHLDQISRNLCPELDHFVAFSSFASGHGNVGQTGYGYANAAMERICELRVEHGLPGLAIQWGAIGDVGAFHESKGAGASVGGSAQQRISSCLKVLDRFLNQKHPVVSSFVRDDTSSNADDTNGKAKDLAETVVQLFGVTDASSLDSNMSLGDLGMDSLVGVEVQQTMERDYDLTLSLTEIRKLTFNKLREMGEHAAADHRHPKMPA